MRIVLKPIGAIVVVVAIAVLFVIAYISAVLHRQAAQEAADGVAPITASGKRPAAAGARPPVVAPSLVLKPDQPLLTTSLDNWYLDVQGTDKAERTIISDPSTPNMEKRYVRATITAVDPKSFWFVQYLNNVSYTVPKNTAYVMRFIGRSSTHNEINVAFLQNGGEHLSDLGQQVELTPAWKVYTLPFKTTREYAGNGPTPAAVCLHLGYTVGVVDLAAVQIYPAGSVPG